MSGTAETADNLRKICVGLSLSLHSGYDTFIDMPVDELLSLSEEVAELGKKNRI